MRLCLRRTVGALVLLAAASAAPVWAEPQSATASELKAAFVVNFVRFTTWPPRPPGHPLVVCVIGDARVSDALGRAARTTPPSDQTLTVVEVTAPTAIDGCQVLFVGADAAQAGSVALDRARERPILTIADRPGFARGRGIIELFVDGNRMRFSVNAGNASAAGLQLSSRLLGLAKVVYGTAYDE